MERKQADQLSAENAPPPVASNPVMPAAQQKPAAAEFPSFPTHLVVHNVLINTASPAKLRVKWLRGEMLATEPPNPASFDDLSSFRLQIDEGLVGVSLTDLTTLMGSGALQNSPLSNPKLSEDNGRLKITGVLKKVIPLPVAMIASIGVAPDHHHVRLHVEKISVLKMPVKRLLGAFSVKVDDFFDPKGQQGIDVNGNDVDIDVNQVLPPPRAQGNLTQVKLWHNGDLMQYYGEPRNDAIKVKQWRNFMRLRGGTVNFGKLTMHNADLLLVDTSQDDWLTFDVRHYQEQLVNGITHITPEAGLQIFIPDINKVPATSRKGNVSLLWMKNRNIDPPPDLQ